MVRSLWIAAVVVGLAWTGLAGAQPSGTKAPGERYVIVRDDGGSPQRCKVLKTWRESNGAMAYHVQSVQTGELMTIVEIRSGSAGAGGQGEVSTRIFHWGEDGKPPAGTPMPPGTPQTPSASVARPAPKPSTPVATPRPSAPPVATPKTVPAPTIITPPKFAQAPVTAPKPASTSMPTAAEIRLPQAYSLVPQTPPNKPSTTVVTGPSGGATESKTAASTSSGMPTIIQGPSASATSSPRLVPTPCGTSGCPTPCNNTCCQPCSPCCPSPPRQSLIGRIFRPNPPATTVVTAPAPAPAPSNPAAPATPVVKASAESAQPRDWRESWGKVEPWKAAQQAKADKPADVAAKRVVKAPVQADPPRQPDPLKDPDWYRGMVLKDKTPAKPPVGTTPPSPPRKEDKPAVAKIAPVPMPVLTPTPPARPTEVKPAEAKAVPPLIQTRKQDMPAVAKGAPAAVPPMPPAPPQGSAEMATVPTPTNPRGGVVTLPADEGNAFWTPPQAQAKGKPEQLPRHNAFDRHDEDAPPAGDAAAMAGHPMGPMPMGGAPMGPMPMPMPPPLPAPPAMADSGVPSGLGNAFTTAGSRRPLPSEFGLPQHDGNAFGEGTPSLVAQGPSVPAAPPRPALLPPAPGMLGYLPPPMPGMSAAAPRGPMTAVNPLMAVPPSPLTHAAPAVASAPEGVPQALITLRDSLYPSQREMAAERLGEVNWRSQPQAVQSLMRAARTDPAPSVRAACVRALAHMKATSAEVVALVQDLKNDRDPRIRAEAEEALNTLSTVSAPRQDSGVRPVSHR